MTESTVQDHLIAIVPDQAKVSGQIDLLEKQLRLLRRQLRLSQEASDIAKELQSVQA